MPSNIYFKKEKKEKKEMEFPIVPRKGAKR
jgi:hypothetical protein